MNYLIDDEDVTRLYFALKDVSHKEVELCMSQVHPDIVQFPESVNGRVLSYITSITDLNCFNIESGPFVTAVFNTIQEWKAFGVSFALLKKQTTNLIPAAQAESAQANSTDEVRTLRQQVTALEASVAEKDAIITRLRAQLSNKQQSQPQLQQQQESQHSSGSDSLISSINTSSSSSLAADSSSIPRVAATSTAAGVGNLANEHSFSSLPSLPLSHSSSSSSASSSAIGAVEVFTQPQSFESSQDVITGAYYSFSNTRSNFNQRDTDRQFVDHTLEDDEENDHSGSESGSDDDDGTIGIDNGDSSKEYERRDRELLPNLRGQQETAEQQQQQQRQQDARTGRHKSHSTSKAVNTGSGRADSQSSSLSQESAVVSPDRAAETITVRGTNSNTITAVDVTTSAAVVHVQESSQHAQPHSMPMMMMIEAENGDFGGDYGGNDGGDDDDGQYGGENGDESGEDGKESDFGKSRIKNNSNAPLTTPQQQPHHHNNQNEPNVDVDDDGNVRRRPRKRRAMSRNDINDRRCWTKEQIEQFERDYPRTVEDRHVDNHKNASSSSSSSSKKTSTATATAPAGAVSGKKARVRSTSAGSSGGGVNGGAGYISNSTCDENEEEEEEEGKNGCVLMNMVGKHGNRRKSAPASSSSNANPSQVTSNTSNSSSSKSKKRRRSLSDDHSSDHNPQDDDSRNVDGNALLLAPIAEARGVPSLNSRDRALLASHVAKIATSGVASNIQLEACKFVIDLFGEKNRKVPLQAIVASGAVQKAVHLVMTRSCKSEEVKLLHAGMVIINDTIGFGSVRETDIILAANKHIAPRFVSHLHQSATQDVNVVEQCLFFLGEVCKIQPRARQDILVKHKGFEAILKFMQSQQNLKTQSQAACTLADLCGEDYQTHLAAVVTPPLFNSMIATASWLLRGRSNGRDDRESAVGAICQALNDVTNLEGDAYLYLFESLIQSSLSDDILGLLGANILKNKVTKCRVTQLLCIIIEACDSPVEINALLRCDSLLPVLTSLLPAEKWPVVSGAGIGAGAGVGARAGEGADGSGLDPDTALGLEVSKCLKYVSTWVAAAGGRKIVTLFTRNEPLVVRLCKLIPATHDPDTQSQLVSTVTNILQHTDSTHNLVWLKHGAVPALCYILREYTNHHGNEEEAESDGEEEEEDECGVAYHVLEILRAFNTMVQRSNGPERDHTSVVNTIMGSSVFTGCIAALSQVQHATIAAIAGRLLSGN